MIAFRCAHCNKDLKVKDDLAGKKVKCPSCGKIGVVPQTAPALQSPSFPNVWTLTAEAAAVAEEHTLPPKNRAQAGQESLSDVVGQTHLGADGPKAETRSAPVQGFARELYDFLAPAEQPDEIGRLGGFRVLKVLGAGGMGVVFQGEDPRLGRKVAIKAMLPHLAGSKSSQERFLREARAAATLEHDHVVPIYHVGEDRGAPFIVMPFLQGESLDDRLKRDKLLPVSEVLRIGREAANGLAAAHARGLIHRDIKPANLWLETSEVSKTSEVSSATGGRVKILDFGLARATADEAHLTQTGAIVGTPAYMAPEQAGGDTVDGRSDLFSLGCVLYRLCTGTAPFKGKDSISTLVAVATENPKPPRQLIPAVPAALSHLVMKLLAKKPEERPQSAQVVVAALQEIEGQTASGRSGRPIRTVQSSGPPRQAGPTGAAKKRLPVAWLAAGGVLGLGIVVAAVVLFWQTPYGTVRIESNDPDFEIVFDKTGPTIRGADKAPITLRAGTHGILVKRGDFTFETDKFLIEKGKTITLRIEWLPGQVQLVQDGKVLTTQPWLPRDVKGPGDVGTPPVVKANPPAAFKNSVGMEFALVPKGKSWLGGWRGKPGNKAVEILHDFYLGAYEVTQEEWEKVTEANPSHFKDVPAVAPEDQKRFPVENVSWDDCQLFLERLNRLTKEEGWVYRLPKDAEWEYACRGGPLADKLEGTFDFYLSKPTNELLPGQANFEHDKCLRRTCKVGSYPPNRLGLYDMHGNVLEWCDDEFTDAKATSLRVFRGGCWYFPPANCRAGYRVRNPPSTRGHNLGLRVARVPVGMEIVKTPPK
jgi:serine/threonine protein kinase/formylglycine-generating enzyme required for sulfatase activity